MKYIWDILPFSPLIILVFFIILSAFVNRGNGTEFEDCSDEPDDHSIGWHRENGTHRVVYTDTIMPNGKFAVSQPFTYRVACDYAKMFDGVVIGRNQTPPSPPKTFIGAAPKATA